MALPWRVLLFAAPLITLVLFLLPHKVKGGEITEIRLEVAPRTSPRISAYSPPTSGASQAQPQAGLPSHSIIPVSGGGARAGFGYGAVAFRWGWAAPRGRGLYPALVDLHELADTQIEEAVIKKTREEAPSFEACVSAALDRGEPIAHRGVIRVVLEDDGEARVINFRMEGPHTTALKDCFWKVISPWRFRGLPPIEHTKVVHLAIDRGRLEETPPPAPTPSPIDRSQGLVTLVGVEGDLPPGGDGWISIMADWALELRGCFERSWDHVDYTCDGPMVVPLSISEQGEVLEVGLPSFWAPGSEGIGEDVLGEEPENSEGGEVDPALDHLLPRCAPKVSPCLMNTISLWRLPDAEGEGDITLQLMVHPPGRLEEAPPPALWLKASESDALIEESSEDQGAGE